MNKIFYGEKIEEQLNRLIMIVTELDARESSSNLIFKELNKYSWSELCNEAIKILDNIK